MSKTKIEDLPGLDELDPEDQRLIGGDRAQQEWRPRFAIQPTASAPNDPSPDDDIIVSRIPPES
jgi:hypothetical protein